MFCFSYYRATSCLLNYFRQLNKWVLCASPSGPFPCSPISPNEERQGGSGSSTVWLDITREPSAKDTQDSVQAEVVFFAGRKGIFSKCCYSKAKVITNEQQGNQKHFPVSSLQDLINKASVTTPHIYLVRLRVLYLDILIA